jgi:ELWxxDGT repeat protein
MKKLLLFSMSFLFLGSYSYGQVTQLNNNQSLSFAALLNPNLAIFTSAIDQTLWVTNGTPAGTFQLSGTIKATNGVVLNGKYIFSGSTATEGSEIFISDGTIAGTKLMKDIVSGATGSDPDGSMAILNGYVYFTATTAATGRELWRTDGTGANTTLVKDIVSGPTGSNEAGKYYLTSMGNYLYFDVNTSAGGNELWQSDGTGANTILLKDIIPGAVSSNPRAFSYFNNMMFFTTTSADGLHAEVWRTNGTPGGTILIKNGIIPGFLGAPAYNTFFHIFNNRAYFLINDGTHAGGIWSTDGIDATTSHTSFVQDVNADAMFTGAFFIDAVNLPAKFIFPVTDVTSRFELWESDGTTAGTKLLKSFPVNSNDRFPFIYLNYSYDGATRTVTTPLYNGNFFFSANSSTDGNELWISDGNPDAAHTHVVKNINTADDGITENISYLYTTAGLFFAADDGTNGNELWKTDGTSSGSSLVKDINPNSGDADPSLVFFIVNGKILFTATDGDDPDHTDLYAVDGTFSPLPVKLLDFTVTAKGDDALLQWSTAQELNSKDFTVQSSVDAQHWNNIGSVPAKGNSSVKATYAFTDLDIMNSGKSMVYYRLIATDIDGKTTSSEIIYLKIKNSDQWTIQLFSNPVHNEVKVLLSVTPGLAKLSINDLSGKVIYKKQLQGQNGLINIAADIPAGIYILQVKTGQGSKSLKFVKE